MLKRVYPWIFGVQVAREVIYFARLYTRCTSNRLPAGSSGPTRSRLPALFLVTIVATLATGARGEAKIAPELDHWLRSARRWRSILLANLNQTRRQPDPARATSASS